MDHIRRLSWALPIILSGWLLFAYGPLLAHDDPLPTTPAPIDGNQGDISLTALELILQGQVAGALFLPLMGGAGNPVPPVEHGDPVAGHGTDDYYLAEQARRRNEPPFVAPEIQAAVPSDRIRVGQWGPVVTWPFVFASAANLPDGRIIAWGSNNVRSFSGGASTYVSVWDPASGQFLSRNHSEHSMFCGIPVMLEDGRVLVNGGDGTRERNSTFDYRTNNWTRVQDSNAGRWYPGTVALPSGQVFTALGTPGSRYPELWTASTGWTYLTGADLQSPILDFPGF